MTDGLKREPNGQFPKNRSGNPDGQPKNRLSSKYFIELTQQAASAEEYAAGRRRGAGEE